MDDGPQEVGNFLCIGLLAVIMMPDQPCEMVAHSIYQTLVRRLMAQGG